MLTLNNIQTLIDSAKVYYLNQIAIIYADMQLGVNNISTIYPVRRLVRSLEYENRAQVIDSGTEQIYDCLFEAIGGYTGLYQIDPGVQIPGQTIIEVPVVSNFNQNRIDFVTTDDEPTLTLQNFNVNYKPLYGNDPTISLYTKQPDEANPGEFVYPQNLQTPPILTYDDDDPTKDIVSIQWQLAVGTDGYILISGIGSISTGNTGGVGAKPITLSFTEADLLYDGTLDQWYLQLLLPGTAKPYYATLNGDSIAINYSENSKRFGGFQNNLASIIKINVV